MKDRIFLLTKRSLRPRVMAGQRFNAPLLELRTRSRRAPVCCARPRRVDTEFVGYRRVSEKTLALFASVFHPDQGRLAVGQRRAAIPNATVISPSYFRH
jgi:hypothetical protein